MTEISNTIVFEVIAEVELTYPPQDSLSVFIDFATVWNLRILSSNSNSTKVRINLPYEKFKKLFNTEPKLGGFKPPIRSESFIRKVNIVKINSCEKL